MSGEAGLGITQTKQVRSKQAQSAKWLFSVEQSRLRDFRSGRHLCLTGLTGGNRRGLGFSGDSSSRSRRSRGLRRSNSLRRFRRLDFLSGRSVVVLDSPSRPFKSQAVTSILLRHILAQILIERIAVRRPSHLLNRVLRHERFHRAHHPLHQQRNIREVLVADCLGVVALEQVDDLGARRFDLGGLAEEADALVVVQLNRLVRVKAFAVVWNLPGSVRKIQVSKCELHQSHSPADESAHRQLFLLFQQHFSSVNSRICVSEGLLAILGCGAIDVEHDDILLVDRVLHTELRSFHLGDIAQAAELGFAEDLFPCCQRVVLFPPFQSCQQLCFCFGKLASVSTEEFL
jgi:hypothetical protein